MDELVEQLRQVDDGDIEALPFFLRWPAKVALGFVLSALVNLFVLAIGVAVGMGLHGQVMCSYVGECLGPGAIPFRPTMLLNAELGAHLPGFAAEGALCLFLWCLANLSLQFGVRHNAGSRLAAMLPAAVLGLAWTGWYALAIGASWIAG